MVRSQCGDRLSIQADEGRNVGQRSPNSLNLFPAVTNVNAPESEQSCSDKNITDDVNIDTFPAKFMETPKKKKKKKRRGKGCPLILPHLIVAGQKFRCWSMNHQDSGFSCVLKLCTCKTLFFHILPFGVFCNRICYKRERHGYVRDVQVFLLRVVLNLCGSLLFSGYFWQSVGKTMLLKEKLTQIWNCFH